MKYEIHFNTVVHYAFRKLILPLKFFKKSFLNHRGKYYNIPCKMKEYKN